MRVLSTSKILLLIKTSHIITTITPNNILDPNFSIYISQIQNYLNNYPIENNIIIYTDGSYNNYINKSAFVIYDVNGNIIISGQQQPFTLPSLRSSYDAEVHAVSIASNTILLLTNYFTLTSIKVNF